MDPLAVVRSTISGACTTTLSGLDTASSRIGAELAERGRRASSSEEVATLSLTPVERISIAVVSNVPTSRFEEGEGELRHLHLIDKTRGHSFISELSSFEVGASGTR